MLHSMCCGRFLRACYRYALVDGMLLCQCVNVLIARYILRYHYRIAGRDLFEEFTIPAGIIALGQLSNIAKYLWPLVFPLQIIQGMYVM